MPSKNVLALSLVLALAASMVDGATDGVSGFRGGSSGGSGGRVGSGFIPGGMAPPSGMRMTAPPPTEASFVAVLVAVDDENKQFAVGTNAFTLPMFLRIAPTTAIARNYTAAAFNTLKAGDVVQVVYNRKTGIPVRLNAIGPA